MKRTVKRSVLLLTPGDPAGIGPEITWKAIQARETGASTKQVPLLCIGAEAPFKKLRAPIVYFDPTSPPPKKSKKPYVWLLPAPETAPLGQFLEGYQAGWAIEKATQMLLDGTASGLATGPISKERLQKGGYIYPGHTEFLATLCAQTTVATASPNQPPKALPVTMMLANDQLRVSLVTTHVALKAVSSVLTREKIRRAVNQTAQGLRDFWGIKRPRIAVTALNPHGGESGLFGREEIEIISPEVQALQKEGAASFELSGPFPADTLFALHFLASQKKHKKRGQTHFYDAIVCMYHDQGLVPVKLLDFHNTVNVTLGLPIIRTSVDHGVGFDIAGKGIADPSSLRAAIDLATHFIRKKR